MNEGRDRIGLILYFIYLMMLLASVVVIGKIVYIQFIYKPSEKVERIFTPTSVLEKTAPRRGDILACDGRKLAMSCPVYDIAMDCTVLKSDKTTEESAENEKKWREDAKKLSVELAKTFPSRNADKWYNLMLSSRKNGVRYLVIAKDVDRNTRNAVKEFPLFCRGRYKGGYLETERIVRRYPYGSLARRTVGFVRDNRSTVSNSHIGIEGKCDSLLHGTEGTEWLRKSDRNRYIRDYDSIYVKPVDGCDVRTTLNIDYQDIADRALREQIQDDNLVEGGCVVLMDVHTGAIRAMVNLLRDSVTMKLTETNNLAVTRLGDPGSVFKTSTIMTLLEDGKIESLDETVPTNHGKIKTWEPDVHVTDYEREHKTSQMPIVEGLKVSSNYVFRYLAYKHYTTPEDLEHFMDRIHTYKLDEAFDFDLDGFRTPMLPPKNVKEWSATTLGSVAIGYSICITPLHVVNFYNAIANKGRMMRPYLIEDIEKNGKVMKKLGPSVLCESICSRATADTLTRGLAAVASEGTAKVLKNAKCHVAGKTGTSQVVLDNGRYVASDGRKKNQGTFVGFFPVENPQYTVIAVVYSKLSHQSFYGSQYPARTVKTIVDAIHDIDPCWHNELKVQK